MSTSIDTHDSRLLTGLSLISILLFTFHFSDDIVRGLEEGDLSNYTGVVLVAIWLYVTLMFAHRRAGLAIMLLFSLGAAGMPLIHMSGEGLIGRAIVGIAGSGGVFFWVWTQIALGVTGLVTALLAARALWASVRTGSAVR